MSQLNKREGNNTQSDSELSVSGGAALDYSDSNSSSSSSVSSSTSCTTDTDEPQLDTLELAKICNETFRLPRGLCENANIFHEFFSADTWNILPIHIREHLQQFMPHFTNLVTPQEAAVERQRTLVMLFNGDLKRFGHSPLIDLQHDLEDGNYRPDVLNLRQSIAKSRRREQRFQKCERISHLAKELFLSRERLLRTAYKSAPDAILRAERSMKRQQHTLQIDTKLCTVRSRKRFRKEIENITERLGIKLCELSADEDDIGYEDLIKEDSTRNLKAEISTVLKTPAPTTDRFIYSTLFKRRHELTDDDAVRADHQIQKNRLSNRNFRTYIREHKRRKLTEPTLPDFETSDIRLRDVCARAQMGNNFKNLFGMGKSLGRRPKQKIFPTTDPPALVPIKTVERSSSTPQNAQNETFEKLNTSEQYGSNILKENQSTHLQQQFNERSSKAIQNPFLPEDGAPFNILDGEVELQQEEVETYGEETLPHFVISNEVVLPTIEQSDLPPQKLLQTPHKEETGNIRLKSKTNFKDNLVEHNMPRLEPLTSMTNRTSFKEKPRTKPQGIHSTNSVGTLATAAIVTPTKRQTPSINTATGKLISPGSHAVSTDLIQKTHACFFSLIRDLFCATSHHRMQYNELRTRIDAWLHNPITALNDWYAHAENWPALLMSAINFLAGDFPDLPEEYVPYIEFKPQLNIFQWIGAGRDSDTRLLALCNNWLQRRHDMSEQTTTATAKIDTNTGSASDATTTSNARRHSTIEMEDVPSAFDGGVSPPPPPPPRCPTTWTVCAATPEEIVEFQRQERERFEQPHRAYTYRMHGYESVVGPVKGIYTQMYALTKARGHSMMVVNRPNFVTILTLVRDATARLPNGEGTRADIAELLKSSQYINLKEGENVLQTTVSGALDRMHTEHDPCVRYDPKRKIWIYLHRNRSEDDFERIHQQQQGLGKTKKVAPRKSKTKVTQPAGTTKGSSSEITDSNINIVTGDDEANIGNMNVAIATSKATGTAYSSMPALVPANPIIVSSAITQQNKGGSITHKPSLNRSLPVPPLKYNIPHHQQQKSLLKPTVQSQTQTQRQQQQHQQVVDAQLPSYQRIQQRVVTISKNATPNELCTAEGIKSNKQLNVIVSPTKTLNTSNGSGGSSTPIIVATPTGLQTVHVSNATVVTSSSAAAAVAGGTSAAAQQSAPLGNTIGGSKKVSLNKPIIINQIRGHSTIANTTSKEKVSTSQILKQLNTGNTTSLTYQQQTPNQQTHSFIIPISMANSLSNATGLEGQNILVKDSNSVHSLPASSTTTTKTSDGTTTTTIYMDGAQFITSVDSAAPQEQTQGQTQQKQTTAKNILRLVPSISSGGVKSILQSSTTGGIVGTSKQPVHVIGHRVVASGGGVGGTGNVGGLVRTLTQQNQKSIGNITLMNTSDAQTTGAGSVVTATPSGSTLIKMSPHTFATLQQKQGQHIVVKQSPSSTNQQQRVIDKTAHLRNSSVVAQSVSQSAQTLSKKVIMQQSPTAAIIQKSIASSAVSVASQTSANVSAAATAAGKVHTINASNLTSQQQRVLLQNIRQQQQQQQQKQQNIQFNTVQVDASAPGSNQQEQTQTIHQIVSRPQTLTMLQTPAVSVGQQQQTQKKAVAVMVSQPQGISRIFKTITAQSQQQQQQQQQSITISTNNSAIAGTSTTGGTRILTTSTGQIISLESLLQKQNSSGSLNVHSASSSSVGTIVKNLQTTNVIQQPQQQQSQIVGSTGNTTTYTVVSQARNANTPRNNATLMSDSKNAGTKTTLVSSVGGVGGRILVTGGGQLTVPQIAKVLGKAGTTNTSVVTAASASSGNIRLIKNAGGAGNSFNIGSLQGKQVLFATKPATTVAKTVGNVQTQQLQTTGMVIGGQTVKVQKNTPQQQQQKQQNKVENSGNNTIGVIAAQPGTQMQTVIMGNQILRVQQMPTGVKNAASGTGGTPVQQRITTLPVGSFVTGTPGSNNIVISNNNSQNESRSNTTVHLPKTVVLGSGGQTIRLHQSQQTIHQQQQQSNNHQTQQTQPQVVTVKNAVQQAAKSSNVGRVVLAVQGGGQIFLSPNFQGHTLNMKSLQNMKVVSLSPRDSTTTVSAQHQGHDKISPVTQQNSSNS